MEKKLWPAFESVMFAWGPDGPYTTIRGWAEFLGASEDDFYNWKKFGLPAGGRKKLARIYDPLRARGADPEALAAWVFTRQGDMPAPASVMSKATRPATPSAIFEAFTELDQMRVAGELTNPRAIRAYVKLGEVCGPVAQRSVQRTHKAFALKTGLQRPIISIMSRSDHGLAQPIATAAVKDAINMMLAIGATASRISTRRLSA